MVSLAFPLSLLFLLTLFWVLFTTSMANLPSAADGENLEKGTSAFSCIYCRKSFANHRSLRGHLRSHNVQLKAAWRRNCPSNSCASIGSASTIVDPLSSNQPGNSCEVVGNNLAFHKRSSPNLTFSMNATFAGSGSTPSAGFPLDVSLSLGLNGVQKLRNDEIQTCQDGLAEGCVSKMVGFLNFGQGERIYPIDSLANIDVMKRSKRAKIVPRWPVEIQKPQIKESSLVKTMEKPGPALLNRRSQQI
ncbi:uncharacterized protein LOC102611034 isoform X2 [Citrus sinensis]|uniref:uncharacterized protein LOC102611034 isoform X2 n=1 Tax=Citrus sinensis TaxID=2711 RepID=UPI0003D77F40|nr:uncharacterized protein LOC102611034 isoform X2 [Citrus sinensis]